MENDSKSDSKNEAITPDSIKSLVRDLKDLRDRVAKKEKEMDDELAKFREVSQKLRDELQAVLELKRESQGHKRESNSKSDRKVAERRTPPRRKSTPRRETPPRRESQPRRNSDDEIVRLSPSFSPSPSRRSTGRSSDSSPEPKYISRERKRTLNTGSEVFHIAGNYMFKTERPKIEPDRPPKTCYQCGLKGHIARNCTKRRM